MQAGKAEPQLFICLPAQHLVPLKRKTAEPRCFSTSVSWLSLPSILGFYWREKMNLTLILLQRGRKFYTQSFLETHCLTKKACLFTSLLHFNLKILIFLDGIFFFGQKMLQQQYHLVSVATCPLLWLKMNLRAHWKRVYALHFYTRAFSLLNHWLQKMYTS